MILAEHFYIGDIVYALQTFFTTIIEFAMIMIVMPPKKFSIALIPIFFHTKFVGNIFKGFLTGGEYPVDIFVPFVITLVFYTIVYIYAKINYEEEKWRYMSFYYLSSIPIALIGAIVSFFYDSTSTADFILATDNYSDTIIVAEWVFKRCIDTIADLVPLYILRPVLFEKYRPPMFFSVVIAVVFVLIEIPAFIIIFLNDFSMEGSFKYTTIFYAIIIPFAMFYTIMLTLVLNSNYKQKKAFLEKQMKLQYDYYSSLEKNHQTIRKINHDIRNHIQALSILYEDKDTAGFEKYAKEIISSYTIERIDYCENHIVNAAVSSKEAIAKEKGIDFEVSINLPEKIDIDSMDIVSVLTNLLDNAIEECERITEGAKNITLSCVCQKGTVAICCENSCNDSEKSKKLVTQKSNKLLHGLGTNIIKKIAEKYDGSYSADAKDGKFSASVLMMCE